MTRSKLLESRKKEPRPDISYDLDGDGSVSHKDLFLAKQFDLDRDGKLNQTERKNAEEAIANGFEEKFLFGLDRAGLNDDIRSTKKINYIRVLQKEGEII